MLLEDILYIPKLGYILILVQKLLSNELIGQINNYRMLFSKCNNNTPIIKAELRNRLYIVSKISKEANKISFSTYITGLFKPSYLSDEITLFPLLKRASQNK